MGAQTFFSVIIPTYNREPFLRKAVDSVFGQTFRDLELIVVDDGSSDGTGELMSSYRDSRLAYLYQPNGGVSKARNKGLAEAKGAFIAFLDSDDRWVPEKLQKAREYIALFPGINIFHTEEVWYRNGELLGQKKKHEKPTGRVYGKALPLCCISISTAVVKREVFDAVGRFDESLEACEDYDLWLRVTSRYDVKLINEYLTIKDGGRPDQLSSSIWGLDRFRIKALEKMLSSGTLSVKDRELTFAELEKKCRVFASGAEKRGNTEIAEYYKTLPLKYI